MTENTCCDEYERMTALSRRRFLGGVAAAGATAVTTNLFGEAVQQASYGAAERQRRGRAQLSRRPRRARSGRPPRRPRLLQRAAQHRAAAQLAGLHRRDVRPPPQDGARQVALGRRRAHRRPRRRDAGGQPLPLLRDGGGGGRRPGLVDTPGLGQPDGRPRRPRHRRSCRWAAPSRPPSSRAPTPPWPPRRSTTSCCEGPTTAGRPHAAATSPPPGASRPGRWDAPLDSRWTRWRGSSRS